MLGWLEYINHNFTFWNCINNLLWDGKLKIECAWNIHAWTRTNVNSVWHSIFYNKMYPLIFQDNRVMVKRYAICSKILFLTSMQYFQNVICILKFKCITIIFNMLINFSTVCAYIYAHPYILTKRCSSMFNIPSHKNSGKRKNLHFM